jgi:predicted metal-dependent peptidase
MKIETMNADHTPTLSAAMRRVSQHWPLAYGKLLALRWEATDATSYGATDGRRLLLNPDGLAKLDKTSDPVGLTAFLLVHEALHALLNHALRLRLLADAKTANIAADYVINALIKARNTEVNTAHGFAPFPFIEGILFDESVSADFSAEEVYQRIMKPDGKQDGPEPQTAPQPQPQPQPQDDGADDDADGDGDAEGTGGDSDQQDDDGDADGGGSGDGDADDGADGEAGGKQSDSDILGKDWVGGGGDDLAEPEAGAGESIDDIEREIESDNERQMLEDAINARAGIGGGGQNRTIDKLRHKGTGTDWAAYLRQFLTSSNRNGWEAPLNAPVFLSTGVIAAGRQRRALNSVAVVIDTSISVPQSLLIEMLGEVQHALDEGQVSSVHLIACDWRVQQADEYFAGDVIPPTLKGGGGTAFQPAFDWIETYAPEVDGIVYLTDGEAYDWDSIRQPQAPVLWLDYGTDIAKPYTFGEVVSFTHR